ncbi:hypothetical protein ACWT_4697 [Actinoplanes sp. SE50]|uniref:hypothetical protein n=1 Tax=unclassified Actinoplanes TaxID=2626549 RepID=UPI00023EBD85|nr:MULTISPECIES: hypothetical protein [unclassified Actinoplanes]AEV85719.1 hypothetical protein ACPL_4828 [Actinoplanes sp. SE50/110]ATO84112.1 hypothetical protein ACWT_4697 [Actinoplanes sp. SE50]SLM01522.1 hypothetical protein ACSP50_4758 [Actinoplanes sp. SE50/110]
MSFSTSRRLATVAVVTAAAVAGMAVPAYAAGTLTGVGWSTSQPQPGATGVRYTWTFTTATTGTIKHVFLTVPTGTGVPGSITVSDLYGLTTGTATLTGSTVDFVVTSAASVSAGTGVLISLSGFTNTSTAGAYSSVISTQDTAAPTIDTATGNTVTFNDTSTAVTVVVAQSTAFSSNTTGFTMLMDPSVPSLATQTKDVVLTVATNAANGYTLGTRISQQPLGQARGATLPAVAGSVGSPVTAGTDTFGYTVSAHTGVGTVQGSMGGGYAGYTTAGYAVPFAAFGPTNGDTVTLTNQAKIDYLLKADTYGASITYSVTPSY